LGAVRIFPMTRLARTVLVCAFGAVGIPLYAAPTIGATAVMPTSVPLGIATPITVTSVITDPSVVAGSVSLQRLDASGRVTAVLGILHDDGQNGDALAGDHIYTLQLTLTEYAVGPIALRVSASFQGLLTRVFSGVMTVNVVGTAAPQVIITSPANLSYLNITPTTVTGTVSDPTATVTVNGLAAPVGNGSFSVSVPLAEGPNIITATATSNAGVSTGSIQVTLDTTPPHVTITSPPDQFVTTEASISVAGNVNDIVVGTVNDQQAQVTVNGVSAQVANRTFLATPIPLNMGANVIQAVARDRAGNAATTQITITRQPPAQGQGQIKLVSGNNQTGVIGSVLPAPLVVALTEANGAPAANKPVIFKVTQYDGLVSVSGSTPAASSMATTNAQGQAQAQLTLGMRAGAGGNTVEAYTVGYSGTAIFTETGTQGAAGKIVIDTGNNQIGAVNQPLPKPLIAVVVDTGNNRLVGVPVGFIVKQGGGSFGGQQSFTVNTDSDGRAAATLTLGFQEGNSNNLIEANFPLNQGFPASFTASGRAPGNAANTVISGVVLDNSNVPIPGVTIRAVLTDAITANKAVVNAVASIQTNAQGQFSIPQAPVGLVKLMVDGSTATRSGTYPTLEYDRVTVSGQNNVLGQPIYLLPLNANQLCVTDKTGGGTLTVPEAPGFSLTFGPGQVTFPGGSQTGCISVTVVHPDKVPMVPGFGQQPRFIVTIQPTGALFSPPAPITLPNVDGLAPRAVTEMYSFDHDIGSFVAIGTGTVSDDGQVIRSNPGVGVLKAGWHCGGNPTTSGAAATCGPCAFCNGTSCVPDPARATYACQNSCLVNGVGTCSAAGYCTGQNLPPGTVCNNFGGTCDNNGQCTGGQCPSGCNSGNPCILDGCANGQCTTKPNPACQNSCNGLAQGSPCAINYLSGGGVSGICDANGYCQVCASLPPGTSCVVGAQVAGICSSSGKCQSNQCTGASSSCPECFSCQGTHCQPDNNLLPVSVGRCAKCSNGVVTLVTGSDPSVGGACCLIGQVVQQPINDYATLVAQCKVRVQNVARRFLIDGCSVDVSKLTALGVPLFTSILPPFQTISDGQDPMKAKYGDLLLAQGATGATAFGSPQPLPGQPPLPLPCNQHDVCYQTCGSDKDLCDRDLQQAIRDVCTRAYPLICPFNALDKCAEYTGQRAVCLEFADVYYTGVHNNLIQLIAGFSFDGDQLMYCKCC
jgi:Glucodextranase, domain B